MSLSPTSGPIGTLVTVSVTGFDPDRDSEVFWNQEEIGTMHLGPDGAGSMSFSVPGTATPGSYSFSAGIKADATDSALADVMRIITDFRTKGISAEELEFTRKSLGQSDARKYEAAFQKAGFLSRILDYDLPASYTKDQNKLLEKLSTAEVNKLAGTYAPDPSKVQIVLVGDKARLWERLEGLGYELEELDKDGNPVKNQ